MFRRDFLFRSGVGIFAGAIGNFVKPTPVRARSKGEKVRVGFIGIQHSHAEGKLTALLDLRDDFELVGVVESDPQLRKSLEAAAEYRNIRWLTELELLSSKKVDAIVIETAVRDLVPTAQRCIDADTHVHLEKPGCESRKAFVRLFDAARARGRHIQMGYMLRHNPAFEFCFRTIREGWLGRVFEVTGSMSKLVDSDKRQQYAEYAGGAMFELGCHIIDAMVTVLGPPQKVTPFNRATRDDRVLDNQVAVFEFSDAIATIRTSIVEPFGSERRHFEVSGENGTLAIRPLEPPNLQLALERPAGGFKSGLQAVELPAEQGRYHKQLREFARIVRGDVRPHWSAEHDLAVQLAVLQASGLPTDS
jgi:predicted dehydrogenase